MGSDALDIRQLVLKGRNTTDMVRDHVNTAEGVYLDIVNIFNTKPTLLKKSEIPFEENILFLDMNLSLLNPSTFYLRLLETIGVSKEDCTAQLTGLTRYQRENGKYTIFPVIEGGSHNPYKKYRSNRVSAHRRIETIERLSMLTGNKIFMLKFVLTFPNQISKLLFNDPAGNEKAKQCQKLFWTRVIEGNVLKISSKHKNVKVLQSGMYSNLHQWSSKYPFQPHYHFHDTIPNYLYNKLTNKFIRVQPYLNEEDLEAVKNLWYECQKEIFSYGENNGCIYSEFDFSPDKINIHFEYINGFEHGIEQPIYKPDLTDLSTITKYKQDYKRYAENSKARGRISNSFKYCTRSYLVDVGNYFDYYDADNDHVRFSQYFPFLKKNFKQFVDKGCIQNKTSTTGYLRNLKKIVRSIDLNRNTKLYEKIFISADTSTFRCPVTQQKFNSQPKRFNVFGDIKSLCVYIAHKSGMIKISTWTLKEIAHEEI